MSGYPDTSFICALYRTREGSEQAEAYVRGLPAPLRITSFLVYEFAQAVRFEIYRHRQDHTKGYSELAGMNMLARFEADIARGAIEIIAFDPADVLRHATRLSENHTIRDGNRAFDILHVATALSLRATEFLTFDGAQRKLAEAEGLAVPF